MLIIESSLKKGLVALSLDGELIVYKILPGGKELSQTIASNVKKILNNIKPDVIAVGIGPGSYTGIRVGLSLAKALAYGFKIPLMGFCSLEIFEERPIFIDAKRGRFYSLFDKKPTLITAEELGAKGLSQIYSPEEIPHLYTLPSTLKPEIIVKQLYTKYLNEGAKKFEPLYLTHP